MKGGVNMNYRLLNSTYRLLYDWLDKTDYLSRERLGEPESVCKDPKTREGYISDELDVDLKMKLIKIYTFMEHLTDESEKKVL